MKTILAFAAGIAALLAQSAGAVPIPNPSPAALAEDIDGSGYFEPTSTLFGVEIFDVGEFLSLQPLTFGFFFQGADVSNTANLFPIFDTDDLVNDQAVVNFTDGIVVDVDEAAVQGTFSGSGNIGFYLTLNAFGGGTLFSDSQLNGGIDYFGAFPFLIDPARLALTFFDSSADALISLTVVNGISPAPVSPVPEPGVLGMMMLGLLGLGFVRSRGR